MAESGSSALEAPYLDIGILGMLQKRVVWLTVLFVGQLRGAEAASPSGILKCCGQKRR